MIVPGHMNGGVVREFRARPWQQGTSPPEGLLRLGLPRLVPGLNWNRAQLQA